MDGWCETRRLWLLFLLISCFDCCSMTTHHHTWHVLLLASIINYDHSWAVLLTRRDNWDPHLVHVKVFRYLFKYFFVKTTEHVLKNGLNFNLNTLSNRDAASDFLRVLAERGDFVVVHEIPILHKCLIVSAEVILKGRREQKEVRFVAPSNWVHRIVTSAHVVIDVDKSCLTITVSMGHWEGFHSAFEVYHTSEVFDGGRCQQNIGECILVKTDSC